MPEEKLKCLYITFNGLLDPLGQSQVLPYIEGLAKENLQFYAISLEKSSDRQKTRELRGRLRKNGISWYRLKYYKHYSFLIALNVLKCFFLSFYLIISKKIKIIHARSYLPMLCAVLLKKLFGTKIIFDMRGFWPEELVDSGRIKKNSACYKTLKFLEKKSILSADWVITLTPEAKETIEGEYKNKDFKTAWMPTCVDEDGFLGEREIPFEGKFVLVYSGSLWSYYNMLAMADFFKVLKSKISTAHFLIIANNGTERLDKLFLEKEINKNDYTILSLEHKDVAKYLLSSDLAISFIYDTPSKKASFPTKIAEYLMAGLPIAINAQTYFLKKLVDTNRVGVVFDKFDENSYKKALEYLLVLLEDNGLKLRCKKTAKEHLGKKVCIDKYLDIYIDLG
jgi:glycosyltransferase involved in cell wall biosynthesis